MEKRPKYLFIRSFVGFWTGTGWNRDPRFAQHQPTVFEAKNKMKAMREEDPPGPGARSRMFGLERRELPLNDKQLLLGDDSVRVSRLTESTLQA